jgi:hypothetical protein
MNFIVFFMCGFASSFTWLTSVSKDERFGFIFGRFRVQIVVEYLTILLRIWKVPRSNLGPKTGYPDSEFSWFSSAPPGKFRDSVLNLGHDRVLRNSFQLVSHLLHYRLTLFNS